MTKKHIFFLPAISILCLFGCAKKNVKSELPSSKTKIVGIWLPVADTTKTYQNNVVIETIVANPSRLSIYTFYPDGTGDERGIFSYSIINDNAILFYYPPQGINNYFNITAKIEILTSSDLAFSINNLSEKGNGSVQTKYFHKHVLQ